MEEEIKTHNSPFTVLVEGNIGSGKTTFLNYFKQQHQNVCALLERVEMWKNCGGHNLLLYMYEDRERWGFTFQSYVQLTMLKQHTFKTNSPIKLMESSVYSSRYCFVEKMISDGILPSPSASVIDEWFKWITSNAFCSVDLISEYYYDICSFVQYFIIVYLRTSPEVVYQRMRERNRDEEKSVSLQYLSEIHEMYENWLYHKTAFTCQASVLIVNADLDKFAILEEYQKVIPNIFGACLNESSSS
ncbi:hypothetical protein RI129_012577 [Pyrocoelia pectoralis]|uniref:Deoxynucleoside kinase domain-containing protein n=1 Tax=Pyrocoelia pectoralis TaxID=417401 RepID=A0AAN7ZC78_9COLE